LDGRVVVVTGVKGMEQTVGGPVETVTERVVLTFVVVVAHPMRVSSWKIYGRFDFDACVLARLRVPTFEGVDDGWRVLGGIDGDGWRATLKGR
jgi:hypothetical protein